MTDWQLVKGKWTPIRPEQASVVAVVNADEARRAIEDQAIAKALDAVGGAMLEHGAVRKSYLDGSAAQLGNRASGGSWGQGGTTPLNAQLIARVTSNLATSFNRAPADLEVQLARQGLTWGGQFPPGRPLDPFFGYRTPPRTLDYQTGTNTQITPRWNRVSYTTLKALWEAYDVAQICTKHLINDVRTLDYHFEAAIGIREDVSDDIVKARQFFDSPDKRQPFSAWLAEYLMDAIRYDAGCLYVRRNQAGDAIALEVVDGTTMIPQVDYFGRLPTDEDDEDPDLTPQGTFHGEVVPGYVQIIQGMPATWLAADDIIYQPINPMPDSQYGLAPLEAVLLTANTDLRFQWHFLNYFTQGSIPAGFMEAPPDLSDPVQIAEFQQNWDAMILGDQQKLRQIRWVPNGAKFAPIGSSTYQFDSEFPLYLMRRTCAAHGITPADLGFTETVNKATSETQVDVQFRVGTMPIVRHMEGVVNLFLSEHLKLRVRLRFDTGREIEDRLAIAQSEQIYINSGVLSPDEPRTRLGYPIALNRPTPRFINNARSGPVPLIALESLSGEIDPETYGPAKDAPLVDHPFVPIPGVMPPIGSTDAKNADNTTAAIQANLVASANGKPPVFPDDSTTSPPAPPKNTVRPKPTVQPPARAKKGSLDDDTEELEAALKVISILMDQLEAEKETAGIGVATGMTGVDLAAGDDEDEDDDERAEKVAASLRQWQKNAQNRLRLGRPPHRFVSLDIPGDVSDTVWAGVSKATTRGEIDRIFKDADPKAHPRSKPGAVKGQTVEAAGIAVVAQDTGRVLMIQRDYDDETKQAAGRWEWPGGRLADGEDPWTAAKREWEEETGNELPKGETAATWSHDGYVGFVYRIATEDAIYLNPDQDDMEVEDPDHPTAEQTEVTAWWKPKDAKHSDHALREEFADFDWDLIDEAVKSVVKAEDVSAAVLAELKPDMDELRQITKELESAERRVRELEVLAAVKEAATPAPIFVDVNVPEQTPANITVNVPEQAPSNVTVNVPESVVNVAAPKVDVHNDVKTPDVHVKAPKVDVHNEIASQKPSRITKFKRQPDGSTTVERED